ncbi:UxaA family hydrolase [Streptomyces sp. NPDC056121]|uniref:UxaA family hydrolase n=1 Tax=Streptomyces sp. NPDC056121 TaxID=3345718 RepID=UPI0035D73EE1
MTESDHTTSGQPAALSRLSLTAQGPTPLPPPTDEDGNSPELLLLAPVDDCLVLRTALPRSHWLSVSGRKVRLDDDLPVGHKIARHDLPAGAPVRKYGAVIGRTTRAVAHGENLHTHNLESTYMSAHRRGFSAADRADEGETAP